LADRAFNCAFHYPGRPSPPSGPPAAAPLEGSTAFTCMSRVENGRLDSAENPIAARLAQGQAHGLQQFSDPLSRRFLLVLSTLPAYTPSRLGSTTKADCASGREEGTGVPLRCLRRRTEGVIVTAWGWVRPCLLTAF
jgi:hypothetical protein